MSKEPTKKEILHALDESLVIWNDRKRGFLNEDDCPLCDLLSCQQCPIGDQCTRTPYVLYHEAKKQGLTDMAKIAAEKEYYMLKGLRDKLAAEIEEKKGGRIDFYGPWKINDGVIRNSLARTANVARVCDCIGKNHEPEPSPDFDKVIQRLICAAPEMYNVIRGHLEKCTYGGVLENNYSESDHQRMQAILRDIELGNPCKDKK